MHYSDFNSSRPFSQTNMNTTKMFFKNISLLFSIHEGHTTYGVFYAKFILYSLNLLDLEARHISSSGKDGQAFYLKILICVYPHIMCECKKN